MYPYKKQTSPGCVKSLQGGCVYNVSKDSALVKNIQVEAATPERVAPRRGASASSVARASAESLAIAPSSAADVEATSRTPQGATSDVAQAQDSVEISADAQLSKMLGNLDSRKREKAKKQNEDKKQQKKKGQEREAKPEDKRDEEPPIIAAPQAKKRGRPPSARAEGPATPVKKLAVAGKSAKAESRTPAPRPSGQTAVAKSSEKVSQKVDYKIQHEATRSNYRCRLPNGKSISFGYGERGSKK